MDGHRYAAELDDDDVFERGIAIVVDNDPGFAALTILNLRAERIFSLLGHGLSLPRLMDAQGDTGLYFW
jgi:hypothetical protein